MNIQLFKKGIRVHVFKGKELIFSKGNIVYKSDISFMDLKRIGSFNSGIIKNLLSRSKWFSRLMRLGFHNLYEYRGGLIGIQRGHIVYKKAKETEFNSVFTAFKGSRPLSLLITPEDEIYFGEYFGNSKRQRVTIFKSTDGMNWIEVYRFKSGEIRHIHGLTWDAFRKGIWIQTGDSNAESALWFTSDGFRTLHKFSDNTQRSRAVEICPLDNGEILVPMDTPLERNFINLLDPENLNFKSLAQLPGSAFHIVKVDEIYLVSTVTEPSEINKTDRATVFASIDTKNWLELISFNRDLIPISYQKYFGYTELSFPSKIENTDYIPINLKATNRHDNSAVFLDKSLVRRILNYK